MHATHFSPAPTRMTAVKSWVSNAGFFCSLWRGSMMPSSVWDEMWMVESTKTRDNGKAKYGLCTCAVVVEMLK